MSDRINPPTVQSTHTDPALRRELYFFNLFRLFEASLLQLVAYGPIASWLPAGAQSAPMRAVAMVYFLLTAALFFAGRDKRFGLRRVAAIGLLFDIFVAIFALHVLHGLETLIGLLLVVNVGAGAVLLSTRVALGFGLVASVTLVGEFLYSRYQLPGLPRELPEAVMFSVTYLAIATFANQLGRQMRRSQALADLRGAEVASLSQLNEMIIRRMRTGVLVIDRKQHIHLMNEAAWVLLGSPSPEHRDLQTLTPELSAQFQLWQEDEHFESTALQLHPDMPSVLPRFARLSINSALSLIFLDDSSLLSRRAEQLTLTTLGRLSASIAHEIRNPLAAISYSAQLLEESPDLAETDLRLVEIIRNHCERMNGIVESILNLAHRERSQPVPVDISRWVYNFVDEFSESRYMDNVELHAEASAHRLHAMIDPQQLHQVITNLVMNAIDYGHLPGEPARVTLRARATETGGPLIEVIDRGPGIPARVVESIFEAFYTTSEHGTGLGLYLARQLCETNQATLEYAAVDGGGSCFRIALPRPQNMGGSDLLSAT